MFIFYHYIKHSTEEFSAGGENICKKVLQISGQKISLPFLLEWEVLKLYDQT